MRNGVLGCPPSDSLRAFAASSLSWHMDVHVAVHVVVYTRFPDVPLGHPLLSPQGLSTGSSSSRHLLMVTLPPSPASGSASSRTFSAQ